MVAGSALHCCPPIPSLPGIFLTEAIMYLKIIAAMLAISVMAGCNTMAGAGKDVQKAGESLENSAKKH